MPRLGRGIALASVLLLLASCRPTPTAGGEPSAADPRAESAANVRLVGHHDLQGRESLVVTTLSDPANGSWVYVGHHESYWDGKPKLNPITGREEWNGTSILDVDDPASPRLVWHIPNEADRNSRSVSAVYDYTFDGSGRDYLIRNSEALTEGETGMDLKYQIFDITDRATDPSKISLVAEITGTPPDSCGRGCGGRFILRAHKGWWSPDTGYFYAASGEPGFRNVIVQIFDLRNPREPRFIGRSWLPGLKQGELRAAAELRAGSAAADVRVGPLCGSQREFCTRLPVRIAVLGARSAPNRYWQPAKGLRGDITPRLRSG
ncbi:MAG: hypothetical protein HY657_15720 [Acidobacteria bacterium]|nr:hypothetical protein [Acidobacteriota bacterium]